MGARRHPYTMSSDHDGSAIPMSDSLRRLAERGVHRRFRKGVQFITEGDHGDTLFIVLAGRVEAFSENDDGKAVTFNQYGPGEYVGEMSLDGGARSANVRAVEPTLCAMVTLQTLRRHVSDEPDFAFELLFKVIRRARVATIGMRQVSLNGVYGNLKDLLEANAVAQADGTRLWQDAPSQAGLARQLGCGREMVNKVMKDWERGGYVAYGPGWIRLLKRLPMKW
jgi:CRP/FNR family transcriptional regulator, cyclic AMP receptor protein